jgi:hypothetical protein
MNKALRKPATLLAGALVIWLGAGCQSAVTTVNNLPTSFQDLGPVYKPTNVYRRANILPPNIRRVALLPLTTTVPESVIETGAETLSPIVYSELEKTKRFEVIPVSPEQMKQLTGKNAWRSDEELPPNLFQAIHDSTGCDAVVFSQLTRYAPYQPLSVGWKFSLVETPHTPAGTNAVVGDPKASIIWSVDEVLDSGDPAVSNAARQYYSQHLRNEAPAADVSTMLSSPTRFGQYAIATLLETLPERLGMKNLTR